MPQSDEAVETILIVSAMTWLLATGPPVVAVPSAAIRRNPVAVS